MSPLQRRNAIRLLPVALLGASLQSFLMSCGENFREEVIPKSLLWAGVVALLTTGSAVICRYLLASKKKPFESVAAFSYILGLAMVAFLTHEDKLFLIALIAGPIYMTPTIVSFSFFWANVLWEKSDIARNR